MRVQVTNVPPMLVPIIEQCGAQRVAGGWILDDRSECYQRHFGIGFSPPHRERKPFSPTPRSPGNVLAAVIRELAGIDPAAAAPTPGNTCKSCQTLRDEMNRRGWVWCFMNIGPIADQLIANSPGLDRDTLIARLREACVRLRK